MITTTGTGHVRQLIQATPPLVQVRGQDAAAAQTAAAQESARENARRFELLAGTAAKLLAAPEPQRVVDDLCQSVMEHLDCQAFFNFLVDKDAGRLNLNAYAGIPAEEAERIVWLDYGVAVCGCAARDGVRIVAEHIATTPDPRTELVKSYGIRAYAAHPLLGPNGEVMGTLSFGTRARDEFSDDDLSLMKAVTDQVAVAMVRMRDARALAEKEALARREAFLSEALALRDAALAEREAALGALTAANRELETSRAALSDANARLQALSRRLVDVHERERRYVADQLYNEAAQVLAALKLHLLSLENDAAPGGRLPETRAMVDRVMLDLHHLATDLRPAVLDRLGLVSALKQYAEEWGREHGLAVQFVPSKADAARLSGEAETAVYRIVQEALMNVALHACARAVAVAFVRMNGRLSVLIEDDGVGFDPEAALQGGGLGLLAMHERAASVGGHFNVESAPGKGACVIVQVPTSV